MEQVRGGSQKKEIKGKKTVEEVAPRNHECAAFSL
jgi:hypothetical protein